VSDEWAERILELLAADKGTKTRFLRPIAQQIHRYGPAHLPTPAQLRIVRPMWLAHERRKAASIMGEAVWPSP
jgi:hypothetical protein